MKKEIESFIKDVCSVDYIYKKSKSEVRKRLLELLNKEYEKGVTYGIEGILRIAKYDCSKCHCGRKLELVKGETHSWYCPKHPQTHVCIG